MVTKKKLLQQIQHQHQKQRKKLRIGFTAYKFDDNFIALYRKVVLDEAKKIEDKVDLTMVDSQNSQQTQK